MASKHPFLEKVFQGTIAAVNWNMVMKSLEGTVTNQPRRLLGIAVKGSYYRVPADVEEMDFVAPPQVPRSVHLNLKEEEPW